MKQASSKRKLQAMATRKKIFDAAIALVQERGIDGFTIDDIQERTGCSRGLFYNYFRSINDILSEIIFVNERQYQTIRDKYLAGTRGMEKILLYTQYITELHAHYEQKNFLRIHYINLLKNESQRKHVRNDNRLIYVVLLEALGECQEDGKLVAGTDLKRAASNIMVILRGAIFEYLLSDNAISYDITSRVAQLIAAYLSGIHIAGIRIAIPAIKQMDTNSITSIEYFSNICEN